MTAPSTAKEWQERIQRVRERYRRDRKRVWAEGKLHACPLCGRKALRGRSDLSKEIDTDGAVLVFANLHGALCDGCGEEFLEGYEQAALEDRAGTSFKATLAGLVTRLGGNKLGTYWPKDLAQTLGLHAKDELRMTPLSRGTVVVRVIHSHE